MPYTLCASLLLILSLSYFTPVVSAWWPIVVKSSIVGSWEQIDDGTKDVFFATFNGGPRRGTFNFTSPDASISLSHGSWKRTGRRTYNGTDVGFIYDQDGLAEFRYKFNSRIVVNQDGKTASFEFKFEKSGLDGKVVETGSGTGKGFRIEVEPFY